MALAASDSLSTFDQTNKQLDLEPVLATVLLADTALLGLVANGVGLLLLRRGGRSINLRAAYLHILGDTLSSVGVVAAAGIVLLTGTTVVDPIVSIAIAIVVVIGALRLGPTLSF